MSNVVSRPPIGFIVEGHGEYDSYPTIVSKIVGNGYFIPRVNAKGNGGILKHLSEHLDDLVTASHPHEIIITIDLQDNIGTMGIDNCIDLKKIVEKQIDDWYARSQGSIKMNPLPRSIRVVIQDPQFEAWLISDKESLKTDGHIILTGSEGAWSNVDSEVDNPQKWLDAKSGSKFDMKKPSDCKTLAKSLNIDRASSASRSFRKFVNEVKASKSRWSDEVSSTPI